MHIHMSLLHLVLSMEKNKKKRNNTQIQIEMKRETFNNKNFTFCPFFLYQTQTHTCYVSANVVVDYHLSLSLSHTFSHPSYHFHDEEVPAEMFSCVCTSHPTILLLKNIKFVKPQPLYTFLTSPLLPNALKSERVSLILSLNVRVCLTFARTPCPPPFLSLSLPLIHRPPFILICYL